MALQSMTGFARAAGEYQQTAIVWELRSVNGRGLDVRLRLPPGREALEQAVRQAIQAKFSRGNIQAALSISSVFPWVGFGLRSVIGDGQSSCGIASGHGGDDGLSLARWIRKSIRIIRIAIRKTRVGERGWPTLSGAIQGVGSGATVAAFETESGVAGWQ